MNSHPRYMRFHLDLTWDPSTNEVTAEIRTVAPEMTLYKNHATMVLSAPETTRLDVVVPHGVFTSLAQGIQ